MQGFFHLNCTVLQGGDSLQNIYRTLAQKLIGQKPGEPIILVTALKAGAIHNLFLDDYLNKKSLRAFVLAGIFTLTFSLFICSSTDRGIGTF